MEGKKKKRERKKAKVEVRVPGKRPRSKENSRKGTKGEKRFFEGESEGSSWRKIKTLRDNYVEAKPGEKKQKIGSEIKSEYEKLVERLNSIDEKIAQSNIEKAICIETLKVLQTIPKEKLDSNEEMIQNKKLKELDKELENLFVETDKPPKSIWEYSINNSIMSSSAHKKYSTSLLKNILDYNSDENNLYKVSKIEQPLIAIKPLKGKTSQEIIEVSDVESTGPGASAEHISDSSQEGDYINKNVSIWYS